MATHRITVKPSTAAYCTAEVEGRGQHDPDDKFEITVGRGIYAPGVVICSDCVTGEPRQAITNCRRETNLATSKPTATPSTSASVDAHGHQIYGFGELYWPWIAVGVALVLGWGTGAGYIVFLASVAAVIGFAFWAPNPCRVRTPGLLAPRCRNWGHGVFRGCAQERDHRRLRNDAWIGVLTRRGGDGDIWQSRQGAGAVIGLGVAVLLLISSAFA